MKYSYDEHAQAYLRIEREGKRAWEELHGDEDGFEHFPNRPFLEQVLPALALPIPVQTDVLEYGCGTGPGACFLAARGFRVDAVDLIPRAIKLARRFAGERSLHVHFAIQDMCELANQAPIKVYELIVDSYCLQSIVTDADRARLFAAVWARLHTTGYYLISTAMFDAQRIYGMDDIFDEQTGICYQAAPADMADGEGAIQVDGRSYLPHRRHRRPDALAAELGAAGFRVLRQSDELGGDLICVRDDR